MNYLAGKVIRFIGSEAALNNSVYTAYKMSSSCAGRQKIRRAGVVMHGVRKLTEDTYWTGVVQPRERKLNTCVPIS